MSVALYVDHHVPGPAVRALRQRSVDVLTTEEDGTKRLPDEQLLERATQLGRVMYSQDRDFLAIAVRWQRSGRTFTGLAYSHQRSLSIGELIENLELVAKGHEPGEMVDTILHLPL